MKPILLSILLLLGLGFTMPALTGCNTTQQQRAAQTLETTAKLVNAALAAYTTAYLAGKVPPSLHQEVTAAFYKYNTAMGEAVSSVQFNTAAATPPTVLDLSNQLLAILQPFAPKPK